MDPRLLLLRNHVTPTHPHNTHTHNGLRDDVPTRHGKDEREGDAVAEDGGGGDEDVRMRTFIPLFIHLFHPCCCRHHHLPSSPMRLSFSLAYFYNE
jgi:hypothetical protein